MQQIIIPGIPAEYAAVVFTLIGVLSSWLVQPVTALLKRLGKTSGVTTVAISAALSFVTALLFAVLTASGSDVNWLGVLVTTVIAFVKANGDYISKQQAANRTPSALPERPEAATVGEIQPPAGFIQPGDGLGDIR